MNKSEFIKELSKQTSYNEERCNTINNIVEDTFIIGKKNKEKIIEKFEKQINLDENEANKLYEYIISEASKRVPVVEHGIFGADMKVSLENDGPFTVIFDENLRG